MGGSFGLLVSLTSGTPVGYLDTTVRGLTADRVDCSADANPASIVTPGSDATKFTTGDVHLATTSRGYVAFTAPVTFGGATVPTAVTAQFVLRDAAGHIVGAAPVDYSFPFLLPGKTDVMGGAVQTDWLDGPPTSATIYVAAYSYLSAADFEKRFGFKPNEPSPLDLSAVRIEIHSTTVAVVGSVRNSGSASISAYVHCTVYRDAVPYISYVDSSTTVPAASAADFKALNPDVSDTDVNGTPRIDCNAYPLAV